MYRIKEREVGLLIHADVIDTKAEEQVMSMVNHPAMKDLIAIMPDVHAGAGSVIGFTGKFRDSIIANIVGVDIGCGVVSYNLGSDIDIVFDDLDEYIRDNIPLGFESHSANNWIDDYWGINNDIWQRINGHNAWYFFDKYGVNQSTEPIRQIGTLGGGNHFIEIGEDEQTDELHLLVHTGSRNYGLKVANFFQKRAKQICKEMGIVTPPGLEYLPMSAGGNEYLEWMRNAQEYARLNREAIIRIILKHFNLDFDRNRYIESVHNYIANDNIVRKGAIQAYQGQDVIIPLNMADGTVIGKGKGNRSYNYSAPHGAGRVSGRREMQRKLQRGEVTMQQFEDSMAGVFSTSIKESTIDESPFAYKDFSHIEKYLEETVEVQTILKPLYNLKAD